MRDEKLERWGFESGGRLPFVRMDDGYWTPWHVAQEMLDSARSAQPQGQRAFRRGDIVRKRSGAAWQGTVVGEYSTSLTPDGYAVESDAHPGSVQIYPAAALELLHAAGPPA